MFEFADVRVDASMAPQPVNGTERKIGDKPLEYPQAFRLHGGNVKRVGFPTYPPSIFFLILIFYRHQVWSLLWS